MKIAFSLENQKKIDENESSFVYLIFPSSLFVACLSSILSINILTNPIEKFLAKNLVFVSYRYHVLCIDCVCVDREESGYTKLQIESFLVFLPITNIKKTVHKKSFEHGTRKQTNNQSKQKKNQNIKYTP